MRRVRWPRFSIASGCACSLRTEVCWKSRFLPSIRSRTTPMEEPVKLLQAQFAANGNSVLTLQDMGPHQSPTQSIISYGEDEDAVAGDGRAGAALPMEPPS